MEDVNIMVGRFQPFTKGHYKCVEFAKKNKDLRTVICWIKPSNIDAKHPFPIPMLAKLYKSFKDTNKDLIADIIFVDSANIVSLGKRLANKYEIVTWTCGDDRFNDYVNQANKYKGLDGISDELEVLLVPRTDDNISATLVRETLLNDDRELFNKLMPITDDETYNTLRKQILNVNNKEGTFDSIIDWADSITYNDDKSTSYKILNKKLTDLNKLTKKGLMTAACSVLVDSLIENIKEIKNDSPEDAREKLINTLTDYIKKYEHFNRASRLKRKLEQRITILENLILENRIRKLEQRLNLYKYL